MTSRPFQDLQTISDLLDQEWDPIGVYDGPRDEHFPRGEYTLHASWIFQVLRQGGGTGDVVALMQKAREYMGEGSAKETLDDLAAAAIVEWWRTRQTL